MRDSAGARLRPMSEARAVPTNGSRVLRFGLFEVDQKAGELRRNGARVRLQDQPLQILLTLLERPGRGGHPGGVAQPLMAGRHFR